MTIRSVPKDRRIQLHQSALNRAGRALSNASSRFSYRLYSPLMRMLRLSNLRLLSQETTDSFSSADIADWNML